jgi:NADH:ubiquinone oxidoreductase subunit E/AmiR/NasT family two-component response regulator
LTELVVLVFERDKARTSELDKALKAAGYGVRVFSDGPPLLAEAAGRPPNLIVLDLDLPHGEGLSLLKALHDVAPGLAVLTETAKPTVEGAVEAMRRGAYNYISKHGPVAHAVDIVGHALEKERMEFETRQKARDRKIRTFDNPESLVEIDSILSRHHYSDSMLIAYLQDIQKDLRYLPQDALRFVARRVNVSLPRLYGIATFYKSFSLRPRGRHTVHVCLGTACHVRGGAKLLESFERMLGIPAGETTYDDRFSLESVRCVGCCGLAPVFMIDGHFYGKMTQEKIPQVIGRYE